MQLLLIHSDYIEYEVKKSTPVAEQIENSFKKGRLDEALTAFMAVESTDEANPRDVAEKAVTEIKKTASQVNTDNVMLYPYAHLSSDLSSPKVAVSVMKDIENSLIDSFNVKRAPFGWYKSFKISCKGHPLSELSRTINPESESCGEVVDTEEEVVSEALKAESTAKSYWKVLTPDGVLHDVDDFNLNDHENLATFVDHEISKSRAVEKVPPHVELMRRLEIADYEPGSDSGNMRYYPKGRLIKSLLERYVLDSSAREGAMEVETPLMYDMNHPTLKKYLDRFPARQYSIESDKRQMFLRFAACFGQFLMSHDMTISHHNLPMKMVELTRYSFRKEQRGELVGLRRLRAFTMPDMHTMCEDMDQAVEQFGRQYQMSIDVLKDVGIDVSDYEVAIRLTRDFYEENKEFITALAKKVNKPVLVEMWEKRFFYFVLKFEFNFVDALKKASALSTVQIDVENAERYDIKYIDQAGEAKRPVVLHCSPSGAIERCIYSLLEKASMKAEGGEVPMLPVWLSPTQVRIIPIAERHMEFAEKIASRLQCRADIDDREETVGKKIRNAGQEWVPYVVVVGDRETESGNINVTVREESRPKKPSKVEMSVDELNSRIIAETAGMPQGHLPLAQKLSMRPRFI
ncbi:MULTISPECIES: threonine--tRNA ligase [Methanohalophilus]|jgi:threonyl-tRNA synthetase|uniref:Threonine--tRNA ligase n=1 Tax=Methanohalophilus euhalobius TaxID=51203 RepID=A0A285G6P2_9EURY|nr:MULTISPECIES: threonine--tRNA ligase [Methanohalophilus]RSD33791.1 MAG: threonyl-tRNA synthetase [Methanohalophilus sp.]ODV49293.1 MAG: threonyl-tRNA synthetase [Methanohalophilus sp. 2-GBenrich]PQV41938.1 threonyl-tRNA synthetase [Methanohalophilus euhalobius]RNI12347.1 threonine--tRNA ligase [Methanohalophilus euhalobius]RSD34685.1 MAG: threonyl-tRNA synthetase [Methanohalophilus sp.]